MPKKFCIFSKLCYIILGPKLSVVYDALVSLECESFIFVLPIVGN
jgi:hypothetical protein